MNKNKMIKILIAMIVIIIFLLIIILIIFQGKEDSSQKSYSPTDNSDAFVVNKTIEEVSITNNYFAVKKIIDKFYSTCKEMNAKTDDVEIYKSAYEGEKLQQYKEEMAKKNQESANEAIYNMLDASYIEEFNINKDNINEKFGLDNNVITVIEKMYSFQNSNNVSTYFVDGIYIDTVLQKCTEFNFGISIDMLNSTFSIYPKEYLKKHQYDQIEIGDTIDINIDSIENKESNTFYYEIIKDSEVCQEYFKNFKYTILYNRDRAYEMLEEEYREKRFGSIDEYKNWVKENYNVLDSSVASKYEVVEENGTKKYICQDNYGNYYIFKQKNISNYTVNLDTYTIDTREFLNKYNSGNEKTKASINVERFFEALNRKDFTYIYNHLDESFKNNYYNNVEDLEEYLSNNLFEYSYKTYKDYNNEGNIQIFDIMVSDKQENGTEKNMTIIIQLKEETDFVMSFSIK